jgi:hypothetical protein
MNEDLSGVAVIRVRRDHKAAAERWRAAFIAAVVLLAGACALARRSDWAPKVGGGGKLQAVPLHQPAPSMPLEQACTIDGHCGVSAITADVRFFEF